jgi:hypothetical protein
MRRLLPALLSALLLVPLAGSAFAQSSQFGIRGLGVPGRELSARSLALGGGNGLFDGESSLNPAAISTLSTSTALFTSSGSWGKSTNPLGSQSSRDTRFPQILVGGPIPGTRLGVGVSYSLYTDRDFTVVSDGIASPRGVDVPVHDTLSSRGGIDDLQIGASWRVDSTLAIGAGFHFLTGSNRLSSRRYWEDTSYSSPAENAELAYGGIGVSVGALWQPIHGVQVAASYRHDGTVTVDRDSTGVDQLLLPTRTIGSVPLPTTLSGAIRLTPSKRFSIMGGVISRNWSVSDSSLTAQGAPGAANTLEVNGGLEIYRDQLRANKYPLRLGARYATLPFLLVATPQPTEYSFSIGTGRRFAADRGGFDIAVEHVWRSQGSGYAETAWVVTIGLSVRPGGLTP